MRCEIGSLDLCLDADISKVLLDDDSSLLTCCISCRNAHYESAVGIPSFLSEDCPCSIWIEWLLDLRIVVDVIRSDRTICCNTLTLEKTIDDELSVDRHVDGSSYSWCEVWLGSIDCHVLVSDGWSGHAYEVGLLLCHIPVRELERSDVSSKGIDLAIHKTCEEVACRNNAEDELIPVAIHLVVIRIRYELDSLATDLALEETCARTDRGCPVIGIPDLSKRNIAEKVLRKNVEIPELVEEQVIDIRRLAERE